jgi:hypothetical protein
MLVVVPGVEQMPFLQQQAGAAQEEVLVRQEVLVLQIQEVGAVDLEIQALHQRHLAQAALALSS